MSDHMHTCPGCDGYWACAGCFDTDDNEGMCRECLAERWEMVRAADRAVIEMEIKAHQRGKTFFLMGEADAEHIFRERLQRAPVGNEKAYMHGFIAAIRKAGSHYEMTGRNNPNCPIVTHADDCDCEDMAGDR